MANNNEIKPVANFGDLVTVVGYGNRVFMVEAFTIEELNEPRGKTPNVVYDLTCPFTFDFIIGEQTDITVVCKEASANSYLAQIEPYSPNAPTDFEMPTYNLQVITPADVAPKPKRKTQRQKQAEIDGLLDELNVLKTVIEICGNDEDYAVRIADVKRKLKEATA